jgi:hypothetical protein
MKPLSHSTLKLARPVAYIVNSNSSFFVFCHFVKIASLVESSSELLKPAFINSLLYVCMYVCMYACMYVCVYIT